MRPAAIDVAGLPVCGSQKPCSTNCVFRRLPGLFRLWDLQFVISQQDAWHVEYVEMTEDGTPLFAVYRLARTSVAEIVQ